MNLYQCSFLVFTIVCNILLIIFKKAEEEFDKELEHSGFRNGLIITCIITTIILNIIVFTS
ncbi:hypothetical protein [Clostridium baratii]|uniref:hypothetical protein n=1 Tax=Clostridium baratii TaxID=1561 RepID=UPI0030CA5FDC